MGHKKGTAEILDNGPEAKEFSAKLTYFMTQKGLSKLDCYNGVVSKTMFNNFLNGSIPKKYTVIALGINMGLDLWEIIDLILIANSGADVPKATIVKPISILGILILVCLLLLRDLGFVLSCLVLIVGL